MAAHATEEQIRAVCDEIEAMGYTPHPMPGPTRTAIGITGNSGTIEQAGRIQRLPGVGELIRVTAPYKLVSREFREADTVVRVGGVPIGGPGVTVIAGPCTVESHEQTLAVARAVRGAGATILRGGAFKPRTSPYAFQGLGEAGLQILAEARAATGMPVVTEVMDVETLPVVLEYADMLQIGARNMQNYALLHAAGESMKTVMVKRGMSATVEELLMAAEYVLSHGNKRVILCERGIRTFETSTRNTTDINAVPVLKALSHLPVVLDPSHSTGNWEYVTAIARAAIAAGADGLIVEVHPHPEMALSDGGQSLKPERFAELVRQVRLIAQAIGRDVAVSRHAAPAVQGVE